MSASQSLSEQFAQNNAEYRRLQEEHRTRERRLEELRRKGWLTTDEEQEAKRLKVEKLHLKDRMAALLQAQSS